MDVPSFPPVALPPSLSGIHLMSDIWIVHVSVLLITADGAVGKRKWSEDKRLSAL